MRVVVPLGYALSGDRTLHAFYERLSPFADVLMALFDRDRLPDHSTLSRFLSALDQATVEALRTQFQADLGARTSLATGGGLWDRCNHQYVVVDVGGTRQAASPRALPHLPSLPAPHRRFDQVAAPGYKGREVRRSRAHPHHASGRAHTHPFLGTLGGAGNGDYRAELQRAIQVITRYAITHKLLPSHMLVRLDGLYGNAAVLTDILDADVGLIGRCRDYALLDLAEVQAVLARPPVEVCTHPERGALRVLYDCPDIPLMAGGPHVRLIVASHPATSTSASIGKKRAGIIYEVFVTRLAAPAFSAKDVLDLYLHRGSFETVLADEDSEHHPDRWCSHTRFQGRNAGRSSANGSGISA